MVFVTCSQQKQNSGCIFIHYYSEFTFTSRVGALVGSVDLLEVEVPPPSPPQRHDHSQYRNDVRTCGASENRD